MKRTTVSERALVLAPRGRDAEVAVAILREAGVQALACTSLRALVAELDAGCVRGDGGCGSLLDAVQAGLGDAGVRGNGLGLLGCLDDGGRALGVEIDDWAEVDRAAAAVGGALRGQGGGSFDVVVVGIANACPVGG